MPAGTSKRDYMYELSISTDYAVNFGRDRYCARVPMQREQMQRLRAAAARLTNSQLPDVEGLWYPEERTDVPDWLRAHGWAVSSASMAEMLARYGRVVPDEDVAPPTVFVSAERLPSV